ADDGPALLVQKAIDERGRLDVLVNNVGGVRIRVDGFLATSDREFEWALQMNFFTGLRATRAALGPMLEQGSGSIVNIASVNSFRATAAAAIATGRFTTPQEVATLVTMLASDGTANVTGVNYVIDGGLIKTT